MTKILILYNYFLPAYKAGGPIQSIANLVRLESTEYQFYIICSNKDYKTEEPLKGIRYNEWNNFEGNASVFYLTKEQINIGYIRSLVKAVKPAAIFVNGMYSFPFAILPVFLSSCHTIFSARGMFHPAALSQKRLKKKVFLSAFKFLGLHRKVLFHATDNREKRYIQKQFGLKAKVGVAGNFPHVQPYITPLHKTSGRLLLGSIGLISPMKNHQLVLQALSKCTSDVAYYIYGPIKDHEYWKECEALITKLPDNIEVSYRGEVPPTHIREKLTELHYFILPSKSENFGHAIFEALSSGRPVITSFFTPWNNLEEKKAGYNVDINDITTLTEAIEKAATQNKLSYAEWSRMARNYALKEINYPLLKAQYKQLFGNDAS